MPEVVIGGPIDPEQIPEMALEFWNSYGPREHREWRDHAESRGFSSGWDAFLSATYLAHERQLAVKS